MANKVKKRANKLVDDLDKAKEADYKSGDFTTVAFDPCVKRLRDVCKVGISDADMKKLKSLQKVRNRLEHFGIDISHDGKLVYFVDDLAIPPPPQLFNPNMPGGFPGGPGGMGGPAFGAAGVRGTSTMT